MHIIFHSKLQKNMVKCFHNYIIVLFLLRRTAMKKSLLFVLITAIIGFGGCGGRKKVSKTDTIQTAYNEKAPEQSSSTIFDSEIDAFVLEEDDLFNFSPDDVALAQADLYAPFAWESPEEQAAAFQTVYFGYDSSRVPKEEKEKLHTNIAQAKEIAQQGQTIVCKGKACKWRGTEAYNLALSDQRAQSVAQALSQEGGIPRTQIKAFGIGTKESTTEGTTKEAHAKDRCVELYTLTI